MFWGTNDEASTMKGAKYSNNADQRLAYEDGCKDGKRDAIVALLGFLTYKETTGEYDTKGMYIEDTPYVAGLIGVEPDEAMSAHAEAVAANLMTLFGKRSL